jgi:cytosine/adenosine deaminase-related metal-dependent hydrolase
MTKIVYEIIPHDHGWAFKLGDTISQSFATHEAAYNAAKRAAMEQMRPGETVGISWEDERGRWHDEISPGDDRPDVEIEDRA